MASDTTATRVHNVTHNRTETAMKRDALATAYDDASRAYDRAVNRGAGETQIAILRARKVAADTAYTLATRAALVAS